MSYDLIWTAFDTQAAAFAEGGDIVMDGDSYEPIEGRPYTLTKLASYSRTPTGPGADCVFLESGTYVMSLRRPAEEGRGGASGMVDKVVTAFPRGMALSTAAGQNISVVAVSAMPAVTEGAWITVPVTVTWFASDTGAYDSLSDVWIFGESAFGTGTF